MLLSIEQALLPSSALSGSTDVTDVTNEEANHLKHSSHVGERAQGGSKNFPISERISPAGASRTAVGVAS